MIIKLIYNPQIKNSKTLNQTTQQTSIRGKKSNYLRVYRVVVMNGRKERKLVWFQSKDSLPTHSSGWRTWMKKRKKWYKIRERRERERGAGMGVFFFFFLWMEKRLDWKDYTHVLIFLGIKHKYVFSLYILKMKKPKH
jgi:hypothetical protein